MNKCKITKHSTDIAPSNLIFSTQPTPTDWKPLLLRLFKIHKLARETFLPHKR